jgi:hypothetical protein
MHALPHSCRPGVSARVFLTVTLLLSRDGHERCGARRARGDDATASDARLNYFFAAAAMPLLLNGLLMGQIQDVLVLLCVPADLSHRIVLLDLRAAVCRPSI